MDHALRSCPLVMYECEPGIIGAAIREHLSIYVGSL